MLLLMPARASPIASASDILVLSWGFVNGLAGMKSRLRYDFDAGDGFFAGNLTATDALQRDCCA
jgi:hypothetical protein